jgi:hypothetical protein
VQEECLKGYTNWKYGTDLTHAGAIEKNEVEVVSAGNTMPPLGMRAPMETTHGCPVLSQPGHTDYLHMSRS